jgi:glucokinase
MFLGIEIGGTKLQLGVGSGDRPAFAAFRRLDVDAARGALAILRQIEQACDELIAEHPVQAIGFGFGGPINASAGIVTTSHQVGGWENFPLADWCTKTFGVPTYLGNDCDMAALAEARYGGGRGKRSVLYVTVGTGVGGGLVLDGSLYGAGRPAVAEIGHLRPGLDATLPSQTVESIASGPGIVAGMNILLAQSASDDRDAASLLERCQHDPSRLTGKIVAEAAAAGNARAWSVMDRACQALGWGIAQIITVMAIEVVIVGGGVSLAGETVFFEPLRRHVERYVFPPLSHTYEIMPAQLGEEVVVHGAVAMAATRHAG